MHPVCLFGVAVCTPCALWGWLYAPRVSCGAACMHPVSCKGGCMAPVCLVRVVLCTPCVILHSPAPEDARGPYSHPHKTHGVHTGSPTRRTGCIQAAPQDTRGAYKQPLLWGPGLISRPQLSAHAILTAHEGTALIGWWMTCKPHEMNSHQC